MSDHPSLAELDGALPFVDRHIGLRPEDIDAMLETLGFDSLDALMDAAVPGGIRASADLDLPAGQSEDAVARELREIAAENNPGEPMIGLGYHATITPPVIRRNVLEDPSWYTAYTPYQPEISQGRLEALINFQTVIGDLTGLPTANASLLDEGTAVAEAMTLVRRANRKATGPFVVDSDALPQTIEVVRTRAEAMGIEVVVADLADGVPAGELCGVLLQYPGASGRILDPRELAEDVAARGGKLVVAADLLALTLLESPGELGADVVVGSSQRFGVPLFYGGPHAGYMAVAAGLERHLPGRLVGVSVDAEGRPAYRLALQTREQHIRRDKATSNICTAQVLLAVVASMYAVHHGPEGLRTIARRTHRCAAVLAGALREDGVEVVHSAFFDTVLARVPGRAADVVAAAHATGVQLRLVDADHVGISCSERTGPGAIEKVLGAFGVAAGELDDVDTRTPDALPVELLRRTPFLEHSVFNSHRSETQMLRYLRRLSARDYALDRGMIPLGSCTMKLNATTEMEPVSLPGFADLHPFAPAEDAAGYRRLVDQLEGWLAEVTGYDRVSIQPNAGSQGELAGLLAIRGYHHANGDTGSRRLPDPVLRPWHQRRLRGDGRDAGGRREGRRGRGSGPRRPARSVRGAPRRPRRDHGDLPLDARRLRGHRHRALPDRARPRRPGLRRRRQPQRAAGLRQARRVRRRRLPPQPAQDVLHPARRRWSRRRTGGGARAPRAVPALARHAPRDEAKREGIGPISAAPYGSAGILPISWAYIRLMGGAGLTKATAAAVLSANYVAARLGEHFPVLYRGHGGLVAHECILDVRGLTKDTGVTVDDVAKRLIDYGFHAPTMSFPVAGTLMVEPTESEDLGEIDRFCDAMIAIKAEIDRVGAGEWSAEESPLRGAPHTTRALVGEWDRAYDRDLAVFPTGVGPGQVLAAGGAHRPGVRRPQPGLRLPAAGGLRRVADGCDVS